MIPALDLVALALSYAGSDVDARCNLYAGPADDPRQFSGESSCALTVRGLWRLAGCAHPILLRPYRIEAAISDVIEIARGAGAYRAGHYSTEDVQPGDVILVGISGVVDHVFTYVNERTSLDGGQGQPPCNEIAIVSRGSDGILDVRMSPPLARRDVCGRVDYSVLAAAW